MISEILMEASARLDSASRDALGQSPAHAFVPLAAQVKRRMTAYFARLSIAAAHRYCANP
jgi:hypothetical protein